MGYLLRLWLGVSEPVGRTAYAVSGFGLLLLKYGLELWAIWFYTSAIFMPWQFLNPMVSVRTEILQPAPPGSVGCCLLPRCRSCGSRCR